MSLQQSNKQINSENWRKKQDPEPETADNVLYGMIEPEFNSEPAT